jgi:hypothetical protein
MALNCGHRRSQANIAKASTKSLVRVSLGRGTQVVANPQHDRRQCRRFSAEDKRRVLAEASSEHGALAALLRRERSIIPVFLR